MEPERIFIVYPSHEEELARRLKALFESWGVSAFYCRQEDIKLSTKEHYRKLLAERLDGTQLPVLLLSRGFEQSKYCQSEAGIVAVLKYQRAREFIGIVVPPATLNEVGEMAPVLTDFNAVLAPDITVNEESGATKQAFNDFINTLQSNVFRILNIPRVSNTASKATKTATAAFRNELHSRITDYKLYWPASEQVHIWPHIQKGSKAQDSVIETIRRSLLDERPRTKLAFVGVSLKFSLDLIAASLQGVADRQNASRRRHKSLEIQLVHMSDYAHVLHALGDTTDIHEIRKMQAKWPETVASWREFCGQSSIDLIQPVVVNVIDYIPPCVGILIDDHFLYEGRCSFDEAGTNYRLWVGERPYFMHKRTPDEGAWPNRRISEFQQFLKVCRSKSHNGVVALNSSEDWIRQLKACIDTTPHLTEVTLLSNTMTRFRDLIVHALSHKIDLTLYSLDPAHAADETEAQDIKHLEQKLIEGISTKPANYLRGTAKLCYFTKRSIARAALIGDTALGIQFYIPAGPGTGPSARTLPGPIRLIATSHSVQFKGLKEELIDKLLLASDCASQPVWTIGSGLT